MKGERGKGRTLRGVLICAGLNSFTVFRVSTYQVLGTGGIQHPKNYWNIGSTDSQL